MLRLFIQPEIFKHRKQKASTPLNFKIKNKNNRLHKNHRLYHKQISTATATAIL